MAHQETATGREAISGYAASVSSTLAERVTVGVGACIIITQFFECKLGTFSATPVRSQQKADIVRT